MQNTNDVRVTTAIYTITIEIPRVVSHNYKFYSVVVDKRTLKVGIFQDLPEEKRGQKYFKFNSPSLSQLVRSLLEVLCIYMCLKFRE